jgi:hypothetical protein
MIAMTTRSSIRVKAFFTLSHYIALDDK